MNTDDYRKYLIYNEQEVIPLLRQAGLVKEAAKVEGCGEYFYVDVCKDCHSAHFRGFNRCHSKFCAICNFTKYVIWFRRLYEFFERWINSGGYSCLLTLTLKDGEDLSERLTVISDAWRTLTSKGVLGDRFKQFYKGGFKSVEIKIGKNSGMWHPHIHVLVLKSDYSKDYEWLRDAWHRCLLRSGDVSYVPQVDIRQVKRDVERDGKNGLIRAVLEVLKYVVKMSDFSEHPEKAKELAEVVKGKRQSECFGVLRNLKAEVDAVLAHLDHKDIDNEVEKTCKVCGCNRFELDVYYKSLMDSKIIYEDASKAIIEGSREERLVNIMRKKYNKVLEEKERERRIVEGNKQVSLLDYLNTQNGDL